MKSPLTSFSLLFGMVLTLISMAGLTGCEKPAEVKTDAAPATTTKAVDETVWHVKAITPEGGILDVKALDKDGKIYDVKAFPRNGDYHMMDIKAIKDGQKLSVKMLVSHDANIPVKAIGDDGTIYDIKALTSDGTRLDVKGVGQVGNIIQVKAITAKGEFYGIKAISPEGHLYDVKGVKMLKEKIEGQVHGVDFYAHIKGIPQILSTSADSIWHIKAIHPSGKILDVKAIDKEGNLNSVKAIAKGQDLHLMDIKAFVGGKTLPVKMLISEDEHIPV